MLGPVLVGIYGAISTKSKSKEEGAELTNVQKTNNFVRDNAGKIAFGLSLPMLIEEAMASIKGQKFANKLLDKNLANRVLKANLVAYSSYLLVGIAGALGCTCAVKLKDHFVAKKEAKIAKESMKNEIIAEKIRPELHTHQA